MYEGKQRKNSVSSSSSFYRDRIPTKEFPRRKHKEEPNPDNVLEFGIIFLLWYRKPI